MDIKKLGFGLGAFAAGAAAWVWGASLYGDRVARALDLDPAFDHGAGSNAPDLAGPDPVDRAARAPEQFRPDPTAVPTDAEREALRPATGPAPTLVADRGSGFVEAAGAA